MPTQVQVNSIFNPLKAELNPVCHLLALVGAHHILHVSRVRVKFSCLFLNVSSDSKRRSVTFSTSKVVRFHVPN